MAADSSVQYAGTRNKSMQTGRVEMCQVFSAAEALIFETLR